MIGIGIDIVDIPRFEATLRRTPALGPRLFTEREIGLPARSLAARFAAKEAIAKALGAPGNLGWHDAEILTLESGAPIFELRGTVAARLAELGGTAVQVSMSHDGGIAAAIVVAS